MRSANPQPRMVTRSAELAALCADWMGEERLAVDTEFVRTRTYRARLGLIQVAAGETVFLLDAVALGDVSALATVLDASGVRKVLHSCGEDLGIFFHLFGRMPRSLFDTQVAAALVGLGFSLSYQALVETVLGVALDKGQTRSDWLRRPLSREQLSYAARDVEHLGDVHDFLAARLAKLGRLAWLEEEIARLAHPSRYVVEPEEAYLRIKGGGSLDRRGRAILLGLCAWREEEARARDLARGFVVRDAGLLAVARRRPRTPDALGEIEDLQPAEIQRHGRRMLQIVAAGLALPTSELPPTPARAGRVPRANELVRGMQGVVAEVGRDEGIAPELLTQRRVLDRLVRAYVQQGERSLPEELGGWRRDVVGAPLLEYLEQHA